MKNFFTKNGMILLTTITVIAVVLCIAALIMLQTAIVSTQDAAEELRQEAIGLEQEQSRLELYIQELGTVRGIIRLAQEKLGLIEPDSVIIQPE